MQMYIGITLITLHVISNLLCQRWPPTLSERSVYTGLELCWGLKQIFISTKCAMQYHTSKTAMPYKTPFPSISWHHFNPKSTKIVSSHTDTKLSGMDTVLNKHTISIFSHPPEDTSSILLSNTAPKTTCYSNLDHIMFLHHCEKL
jgi:hypothetical protein